MRKVHRYYLLLTGICVIGLGVLLAGKWVTDSSRNSNHSQSNVTGKNTQEAGQDSAEGSQTTAETDSKQSEEQRENWINPSGNTLETRILPPEGFVRQSVKEDSLTAFLRSYSMKKDGSDVRLYNGKKKGRKNVHAAVFKLPLENVDLQQCADSVMRVYAEYYWHTDQKDKIAFHFVDGFLAEYDKWQQGYRIEVGDSSSRWVKSASPDSSYECFQKYLRIVFSYASTLSQEKESKQISIAKIEPGDIFIKGGSPGHVVMVVDVCENADGRKAFLLAQGYMPAQEFHVLKNPAHQENPWYYVDEITYPFQTPEYTFKKGSLRRPEY